MSSGDYFEFSIAHDRKYTLDHLWVQVLDDDEEDMTVKLGISEFIRAEYGDILRVVLSKPEDDSEFQIDSRDDDSPNNDDDSFTVPLSRGDELDTDDLMITSVKLKLSKEPKVNASYKSLKNYLIKACYNDPALEFYCMTRLAEIKFTWGEYKSAINLIFDG